MGQPGTRSVERATLYTRGRFEALTDGVFSVAMTLLVIDVRLPDSATPWENSAFVAALRALEPKLLAYAISFAVVGVAWLGKVEAIGRSETLGRGEALLTLVYLFLVTLTPFSTMVLSVGALGVAHDLLPAVWIYCGNLGAMGLTGFLIQLARRADAPTEMAALSIVSPLLLLAAGLSGAGMATLGLNHWAYAFLITFLGPPLDRRVRKAAKPKPPTDA